MTISDASSAATVTRSYNAHSFNFDSDDSSPNHANANSGNTGGTANILALWNGDIAVQKNNNFIEILPAGIQVVSGTGRYSRLSRRDQGDNTTELLEVIDGNIRVESRVSVAGATSYDTEDNTAIDADGHILPITNNTWSLGLTGERWKDTWTEQLNGTPIGPIQLIAGCYFTVNSSGNVSSPYSDFNVASITRNSTGVFTLVLDSTDGFTLSSALGFADGYGRNSSANAGPGTTPGDSEFTFNSGVKVNGNSIQINTKDNNNDADRDPARVSFVLFGK
jgi:hypothetical protein